MNPAPFRVHIEAYLNLRSSLGFQTEYESYNLRALSDYVHELAMNLAPLGIRHLDMPLTPERVWRSISEARG